MQLTEQQKYAINHLGNAVITACPGSGKTTIVKHKIISAIRSVKSYQGVIAISFTVKSSRELRTRSTAGGVNCKSSFFGTIDSFCLKEIIIPFINRVWNESASDLMIVKNIPKHKVLDFSSISESPSTQEIESKIDAFQSLYQEGFLWMSSFAGLAGYILEQCPSALRYLKSKYTHVFVDEYQDTSLSQHELFLSLVRLGLIGTAVGDTDQSIFAFRGGDSQHILDLQKDTSEFAHFVIDKNHRSHPSIVNYASRLLDSNFDLVHVDDDKNSRVIRTALAGNTTNAAEYLSKHIQKWVDEEEDIAFSNIVFLAKKESTLMALAEGLSLKYRVYIDSPLHKMDSTAAEFVIGLLSYYFGSINSTVELIDIYIDDGLLKNNSPLKKRIKQELSIFKNTVDVREVCRLALDLLKMAGYVDADRLAEVISQLNETLNDEKYTSVFKSVVKDEIQLMTLHKSKGLEFKVVFHFDLEEWSFPYRRPGNTWSDPPDYPNLVQETNLHYVGITRAEEYCVLVSSELRKNAKGEFKKAQPSYFLTLPQLKGLYS